MRNKLGLWLIILGICFICAGLLLYSINLREDIEAGEQAQAALSDVKAAIQEQLSAGEVEASDESVEDSAPAEDSKDAELLVVSIDGYDYIGYISIESVGIELPVMADWDQAKLKVAPCRQFGSTFTDDLVIAAHNYSKHFGALEDVAVGDTVTFTDMRGDISYYRVVESATVEPTDVAAVRDSGHDLVLYTCNYSGAMRIALFCDYN